MKRALPTLCLAAVCAVGLAAQTPQEPAATRPSASAEHGTVTLTGCVKEGAQPGSFTLTDIKTGAPDGAAAGTAGTAGANIADFKDKTVRLTGSTDLKPHVGHTVSVTGSLASADKPMGTSGTAPTTPPASAEPSTPPADAAASGPSLNVSSVSMVSATCGM